MSMVGIIPGPGEIWVGSHWHDIPTKFLPFLPFHPESTQIPPGSRWNTWGRVKYSIVGTFFNFLSSFFVTNLCFTILLVCTTYKQWQKKAGDEKNSHIWQPTCQCYSVYKKWFLLVICKLFRTWNTFFFLWPIYMLD